MCISAIKCENIHFKFKIMYIFMQKLSVGEKRGPRASFKLSRKLPFIKKRDISSEEPEEMKRTLIQPGNNI